MTSLAEATAAARRIQAMGFAQFEHDGREFYDAGRLLAGFVLAGQDCDGSSDCAAAVHVHGCFADDGKCDEPNEHGLAGDTERLREALACAKCGGIDIQTRHHLGASYWGDARHCANGSAVHPGAHRSDEHLHRTCQTCRFDWVEDALVEGGA